MILSPNVFPLYDATDKATPSLWQTADDRVMGGESVAHLSLDASGISGACLIGAVSLAHNGGFVQMKWALKTSGLATSDMHGVYLEVRGNHENYNVHLRTSQLWLPWQSYRQTFEAYTDWKTLFLPFASFTPHATRQGLNIHKLTSIAIVAIGRAFEADVCVRKMGFYREAAA